MGCPDCGGAERDPIAPNYWRCRSLVTRYETVLIPDPSSGHGAMRPVQQPVQVVCGVEYPEGTVPEGTPSCACGTFAIGACGQCSRPVCGGCSTMRGGRRLCTEDAHAFDATAQEHAAAEAAQARDRAAADKAAQEASWEAARASRLSDLADAVRAAMPRLRALPHHRLAVTELKSKRTGNSGPGTEYGTHTWREAGREVGEGYLFHQHVHGEKGQFEDAYFALPNLEVWVATTIGVSTHRVKVPGKFMKESRTHVHREYRPGVTDYDFDRVLAALRELSR